MINSMSIEEKIGQMFMVGIEGTEINDHIKKLIQKYKVSGFILYRKNYNTYNDMLKLIKELKKLNSENKVPLFIAIDQEGGRVNRMPSEIHNLLSANQIASTQDIQIIKESGAITGELLQKSGYNLDFSPVLDVLQEKTSVAIGNRSYGKTPEQVSEYGIEVMKQLQKRNIISVIKHFPGQGAAKSDSHYLLPRIKDISSQDIKPFENAIKEGADIIMVGHMIINSVNKFLPASLSKEMINMLRIEYNFKGVIMTDDLKMRAIRYFYGTKKALKKAIIAGNDLILFRFNKRTEKSSIESIINLVKKGEIEEKRIDESVERIVALKQKYGLNDNRPIDGCNIEEINKRIDFVNEFAKSTWQFTIKIIYYKGREIYLIKIF